MTLRWCDDAASHIQELVREGNADVDYVLFQLDDPKQKSPRMELFGMGKGGRAQVELLLLPQSDKVITGAFLTSAIDERGSVVSVRRKYIHVIWVGTAVSIMVKGKVNTSLTQPFRDKFPGCALYLQLSDGDVDDLQTQVLERTLLSTTGGDVTRYSFTNRTLIGSLQLQEDDDDANNEEQRRREEEERRLAALEARRRAAEAEAQRKAEAEAQRLAEDQARRQAEAERRRAEEARMAQLLAEEEARRAREAEEEEARRRRAYEEEQRAKSLTPKAALTDKTFIMLISSMSGNMGTSSNQALAKAMLEALEVVPEVVDGADPSQKELRDELFAISGLRGKYPLFFLRQLDGTIKFFADFDTLAFYNDTGSLAQQIGGCATPKNQSGIDSAAPPAVVSTLNGNKLLLLISSMSGSLEVSSNQNRVQGILTGLHLPKEEVEVMDGCDPTVKDRRNELFGISGIRAKYPQLFLVNAASGATAFVGNYDDISYLHDTNTFAQVVGLTTKTIVSEATVTPTEGATITGGDQAAPQVEPLPAIIPEVAVALLASTGLQKPESSQEPPARFFAEPVLDPSKGELPQKTASEPAALVVEESTMEQGMTVPAPLEEHSPAQPASQQMEQVTETPPVESAALLQEAETSTQEATAPAPIMEDPTLTATENMEATEQQKSELLKEQELLPVVEEILLGETKVKTLPTIATPEPVSELQMEKVVETPSVEEVAIQVEQTAKTTIPTETQTEVAPQTMEDPTPESVQPKEQELLAGSQQVETPVEQVMELQAEQAAETPPFGELATPMQEASELTIPTGPPMEEMTAQVTTQEDPMLTATESLEALELQTSEQPEEKELFSMVPLEVTLQVEVAQEPVEEVLKEPEPGVTPPEPTEQRDALLLEDSCREPESSKEQQQTTPEQMPECSLKLEPTQTELEPVEAMAAPNDPSPSQASQAHLDTTALPPVEPEPTITETPTEPAMEGVPPEELNEGRESNTAVFASTVVASTGMLVGDKEAMEPDGRTTPPKDAAVEQGDEAAVGVQENESTGSDVTAPDLPALMASESDLTGLPPDLPPLTASESDLTEVP